MASETLLDDRMLLDEISFVELVVHRVRPPVKGSPHPFKYRLAYIENGRCVIRYDNEAGKGDHRHIGRKEEPYRFSDQDQLAVDFWMDVDEWRRK